MINTPMTYGEFLDYMKEAAEGIEYGESFIEEWELEVTQAKLEEYRPLPLDERLVFNFVRNAIEFFRHIIDGTWGDDLREERLKGGHDFLLAMHAKFVEIGIEVPLEKINVSLTICDSMASPEEAPKKASELLAKGHLEIRPYGVVVVAGKNE